MAKEDISLGVEMGRLKIEPVKLNKSVKDENPFVHLSITKNERGSLSKTCLQTSNCSCSQQKKSKNVAISKKKSNKILKEPVLKLLQNFGQNANVKDECPKSSKKGSFKGNSDILSLCSLVDTCNQLRISSSSNEQNLLSSRVDNESVWWNWKATTSVRHSQETVAGTSTTGSCSQQALNPSCDVTIDELASYFETLVHIPKKMSSMAEMMYI